MDKAIVVKVLEPQQHLSCVDTCDPLRQRTILVQERRQGTACRVLQEQVEMILFPFAIYPKKMEKKKSFNDTKSSYHR